MANFPLSRKPSPKYFSQNPFKPQVKTNFDAGYVQSRANATRSRMEFSTGWDGITETELQSLITFFEDNIGTTFNWTHPTTSTVYTVRFVENRLPKASYAGQLDGEDAWELGPILLEEA